jgi:hypothetical protein
MASGFLLVYQGYWCWITAGHVIKEILKFQKEAERLRVHASWNDGFNCKGAESIPLSDFSKLASWHIEEDGLDLGIVLIKPYEARLIQANPEIEPLSERVWMGRQRARPESYYIVGSPDEWQSNEIIDEGKRKHVSADFPTIVIPLEKIDPPANNEDAFWRDPFGFHGRITSTISNKGKYLKNIVGISGGPIFGLMRRNDGQLRYWLYAIQSRWIQNQGIVRGTEVAVLEHKLAKLFHSNEEEGGDSPK